MWLLRSHPHTFAIKYLWFLKLPEAAVNSSLMDSKLEEVAVKPFAYFYKEPFMALEVS